MAEKVSEGVRRLSLVLGIVGLIPWGYMVAMAVIFERWTPLDVQRNIILCGPVAFLIPWGIVRVIAWVVAGFRGKG